MVIYCAGLLPLYSFDSMLYAAWSPYRSSSTWCSPLKTYKINIKTVKTTLEGRSGQYPKMPKSFLKNETFFFKKF